MPNPEVFISDRQSIDEQKHSHELSAEEVAGVGGADERREQRDELYVALEAKVREALPNEEITIDDGEHDAAWASAHGVAFVLQHGKFNALYHMQRIAVWPYSEEQDAHYKRASSKPLVMEVSGKKYWVQFEGEQSAGNELGDAVINGLKSLGGKEVEIDR